MISKETTDWGICYYYTFPHYQFAIYMYSDDPESAYLANVETQPEYRKQGYGNRILNKAVRIAKSLKVTNLFLKCLRSSWVNKWYQRKGYTFYSTEDDYNWLRRTI